MAPGSFGTTEGSVTPVPYDFPQDEPSRLEMAEDLCGKDDQWENHIDWTCQVDRPGQPGSDWDFCVATGRTEYGEGGPLAAFEGWVLSEWDVRCD